MTTTRRQTSIKVDPVAWDSAKKIFQEYNMTVSDAINIFLNRVRLDGGLPFDIKVPTERLRQAMDEAENDNVVEYNSIDEMMADQA